MDDNEAGQVNPNGSSDAEQNQPAVGWHASANQPDSSSNEDGPLGHNYRRVTRIQRGVGTRGAAVASDGDGNGAITTLPDRELEWNEVEVQHGGHPGDRYIKYLRPRMQPLTRNAPGEVLQVDQSAIRPHGFFGRIRRFLIGNPIASNMAMHETLTKVKALAVLSSDALSSVAYATEQIILQLAVVGAGAVLGVSIYISLAITMLLFIVAFSYRQTIAAYPKGGGSYIVSKANLGTNYGLIAAAALMIDYTLTVAVSISSGVQQVASAIPEAAKFKVWLALFFLTIIVVGNLRGIREAGAIFAAPTYLFIFSIAAVIFIGLFQVVTGTITPELRSAYPQVPDILPNVGIFLVLQAFAAGCSAMTGVEAISDGVPAFQKPEAPNARTTLTWMAGILAFMFIGISFLAQQYQILGLKGEESVVSQIARHTLGSGIFYAIYAVGIVAILVLAANTAFSDFPRLASFLARDKFLPNQFLFRGDRLAFNTGIITLAFLAGLLVVIFDASTDELIPLYAIGVFLSFTLSQAGMVMKWYREKQPGWRKSAFINGLGATATALVFIVIAVTKFNGGTEGKPMFKIGDFQVKEGAWIVMIIIPLMLAMFRAINRHYDKVARELSTTKIEATDVLAEAERIHHLAVVPVAVLNQATLRTLLYARSVFNKVQAIHVTDSIEEAEEIQKEWRELMTDSDIRLVVLESPYRALVRPLITYVDDVQRKYPDRQITVVLPEFVAQHWWEHLLHNQTALRLKGALLFHPGIVVTSVPYHIGRMTQRNDDEKHPPSGVASA
jgi:amino acid transporter